MVLRLTGLLLTALALAGCASAVPGSPIPNADAAKLATEPLTARDALGDYATVDFCSLVDLEAFPDKLGEVDGDVRRSFDDCAFMLTSTAKIVVSVGYLETEETLAMVDRTMDRQRKPPRGLRVERGQEDDDLCVRFLVFADEVSITVSADSHSDEDQPRGDWCPIADAALSQAIDRLVANKVAHVEYRPGSFGRIDPCDLVPAGLVERLIGVPDAKPLRFPAGHQCQWGWQSPTSPSAHVYFDAAGATFQKDVTKVDYVAGRVTGVTPTTFDGLASCSLETLGPLFRESRELEAAIVQIVLADKEKDACAPARELAGAVWPKLPKP